MKHKLYLIGIGLLFLTDVIWVFSAEFLNYLFLNESFDKVFFSSYFKTAFYSILLLGFVQKPWRRYLFTIRGDVTFSDDISENNIIPPLVTRKTCIILSFFTSIFFFLTTYFYQKSLSLTTPSLSSVFCSLQCLFFLSLSHFFPVGIADRFNLTKLFLCILCVLGAILVQQTKLPLDEDPSKTITHGDNPNLGNFLAVLSSFFFAFLMIICQYILVGGEVKQDALVKRIREADKTFYFATTSHQPSFLLILGLAGLFSLILYFPVILVLHLKDIESLPCEFDFYNSTCVNSSWRVWTGLTLNALISAVFGEIIWFKGSLMTSSLVGGLFMNLISPMSVVGDFLFHGLVYGLLFHFGNFVIFISVTLTMLFTGQIGQDLKRLYYTKYLKLPYNGPLADSQGDLINRDKDERFRESSIPCWDPLGDTLMSYLRPR